MAAEVTTLKERKAKGVTVHPEFLRRSAVAADKVRNPFVLPSFPPALENNLKNDKVPLLAQDDNLTNVYGWASNQLVTAAYAEGVVFLGYSYLAGLAQRAEYRVVTEIIATEMTREWIELKVASGNKDKNQKVKEIMDEMDNLNVQRAFRKCTESDGFYGRGHLYLDTGCTDDPDELKMDLGTGRDVMSRTKVGSKNSGKLQRLRAIQPVEATWAYPTHYESTDPLKQDWYAPQAWYVMHRQVHSSRFITMVGREVPDILKPAYAFGGLSMSQMIKPYVDNWLRTRQSVADLINNFSKDVLKTNMDATTSLGGDKILGRVALYNNIKNNQGTMVLDKDTEDFVNVSAPLGTLDSLQAQSQEHMAAISRIPIVKLLGIQPAGLNASSEGELIAFEDWIAAFQNVLFRPPLRTIIDFIQLSLYDEVDDDITFDFKPLRQLKPLEKEQLETTKAQTREVYVQVGAVDAMEVRKVLADDPDSPFQGLDLSEPLPPPQMDPSIMGMPGAGNPGQAPGPPPGPRMPGGGAPTPGAPPNQFNDNEIEPFDYVSELDSPSQGVDDDIEPFDYSSHDKPEGEDIQPFNYAQDSAVAWDASWDPSKHPRGNPENAGEFVAAGGSGTTKKKEEPAKQPNAAPKQAAPATKKPSAARAHLKPAGPDKSTWPEHIQKLKVPPAWSDVQISHDPKADLLVVGNDTKGRPQYIYSAAKVAANQQAKFQRVKSMEKKIGQMVTQNENNMKSRNPAIREAAACQNLIIRMGLRPGGEGETGAEKKAYGASTLEGRHVVVDAVGNTRLQFVGKKGVNLDLPVTNPTLAKDLKERAEKVGENGKLFDTSDDNLRRYVKTLNGGGFKVKDFRTHLGTSTAADLVKAGKAPTTPAEYKRRVLEVAKSVSQILGNTPSIALASYINPVVFAGWKAVAGA